MDVQVVQCLTAMEYFDGQLWHGTNIATLQAMS